MGIKRFLISNFLASADIKVFGRTMLLLIGLAIFYTQGVCFHDGLARAFANLRAVPRVNNSLSGCVVALLLGLATHYRES